MRKLVIGVKVAFPPFFRHLYSYHQKAVSVALLHNLLALIKQKPDLGVSAGGGN